MAAQQVPGNALFVCFGCLPNVGTLTGLASLEVVRQVGPHVVRGADAPRRFGRLKDGQPGGETGRQAGHPAAEDVSLKCH